MQGTAPDKDAARAGETMNSVFRVYKYPVDYAAFTGKILTPGDVIEKSNVTSVNDLIDGISKFKVFPNPFTNRINLLNSSGNEEFELVNLAGQSVWKGKEIEQRDFSGLRPGIFLLNIFDGDSRQTIKLIRK
jgi:hypothetical protein